MVFQDRTGSNLNRKRLRIISQTAEEIIADVERADTPTNPGTPINASVMNQFQSEIDTANSNASTAVSTANSAVTAANTAAQNASNAVTTANTAAQDATTAISTANAANTKALYVESQLADRGATIKVNGVSQTEVNFSSDPQTQLNTKTNVKINNATVNELNFSSDPQTQLNNKVNNNANEIKSLVRDYVYPVGSIYTSVNSTNPSSLFGGTWEQIQDRFLLACGNTYSAGNTGGEAEHLLTISEMPSHTHIQNSHRHSLRSTSSGNSYAWGFGRSNCGPVSGVMETSADGWYDQDNKSEILMSNVTPTNQNTGGGTSHNNMPPYLVVYVWKRIS